MENHLPEIAARHPRLFENGQAPQWSYVLPGWASLLEQLCVNLEAALPPGRRLRVVQVKEKFGGLRFYYDLVRRDGRVEDVYYHEEDETEATKAARALDRAADAGLAEALMKIKQAAENKSQELCEGCGCPSEVRREGWHTTMCPACLAAVRAEREAEREGQS